MQFTKVIALRGSGMNSTDFVRMTSHITLSGEAYMAVVRTDPDKNNTCPINHHVYDAFELSTRENAL